MIRRFVWMLIGCVGICGCGQTAGESESPKMLVAPMGTAPSAHEGDDRYVIGPDNTSIRFVGKHTGDDPEPHSGGFETFSGVLSHVDGVLTGISISIETASMTTDDPELTQHLKTPDFFSVREHPLVTFRSTEFRNDEDGRQHVTGTLNLLGVNQEISFPLTVSLSEGPVSLDASFALDRTRYGMTFGRGKIDELVQVSVRVGGK